MRVPRAPLRRRLMLLTLTAILGHAVIAYAGGCPFVHVNQATSMLPSGPGTAKMTCAGCYLTITRCRLTCKSGCNLPDSPGKRGPEASISLWSCPPTSHRLDVNATGGLYCVALGPAPPRPPPSPPATSVSPPPRGSPSPSPSPGHPSPPYDPYPVYPPYSPDPPAATPPPPSNLTCADVITSLAPYDYLLGENPADTRLARLNQKLALAPVVQDAAGYAGAFQYLKSKGTGFSCGFTQNWAAEVFEGLEGQYPYMLAGGAGDNKAPNTAAGYKEYIGSEVTSLFAKYASLSGAYIFYIYHGAAADHVLLIEQLANQQGYRVYQSYNSVYSLKAWLEPGNMDALAALWGSDPTKGFIVPNNKLYGTINGLLLSMFNGTYNVTNLPPASLVGPDVYAYLTYWTNQAINKTKIIEDLYASKVKYGGGRVIPQPEFVATYLIKFAQLTAWYKENMPVGGSARMPQDIFDAWTDLYGSPNPVVGAGLPVNIINPITVPYFMQIKVVETTGADCWYNSRHLFWSLNQPW